MVFVQFEMSVLTELSIECVPRLRDLFLREWPEYISSYYTIDNYLKWIKSDSQLRKEIKFYTLGEDWKSTGTFLLTVMYLEFKFKIISKSH